MRGLYYCKYTGTCIKYRVTLYTIHLADCALLNCTCTGTHITDNDTLYHIHLAELHTI